MALRTRSLVWLAAIVLVFAVACGAALPFVRSLLSLDAARVVDIWASGATPFDIDFSDAESIIPTAGSRTGEIRFEPDGATITAERAPVPLTLRLAEGGLPAERIASLTLRAEATAPARWKLIAYSEDAKKSGTIAAGSISGNGETSDATHPALKPEWTIRGLQLRIEPAVAGKIRLHVLRFTPDFRPDIQARCQSSPESPAHPHCEADAIRWVLPPIDNLAELLDATNHGNKAFPGLAIEPAIAASWIGQRFGDLSTRWLRWAQSAPGLYFVLATVIALSLLSVLAFQLQPSNPGRCARPLLLAALLLPFSGQPTDQVSYGLLAVFGIWLCCALWLGSKNPPMDWLGKAKAWRDTGLFTLAGFALLLILSDQHEAPDLKSSLRYLPWVMLQQWLLQRLIRPFWESLHEQAIVVAAGSGLIFALLHFPNTGLMLFSAMGAVGWTWLGQRNRAMLPLVASHWLLGLAALSLLSPSMIRNAEIGARFLLQR